jgi:predicted DNA-binding ribbon-helix-helix protein
LKIFTTRENLLVSTQWSPALGILSRASAGVTGCLTREVGKMVGDGRRRRLALYDLSPPLRACRNVTVCGRRTSVSLEHGFWTGLGEICAREDMTVSELCSIINCRRGKATLTASVRVFVVSYFRAATPDDVTCQVAGNQSSFSHLLRIALEAVG